MKTDDLTSVKYIGALRMKSLNDSGITTIKQLHETPVEELALISTIGRHYAKLIKASASKIYREKSGKTDLKTIRDKDKADAVIKPDLEKRIKILKKRLNVACKNAKTLKKKQPELYSDFKKRAKNLLNRLNDLTKARKDFAEKIPKNFIEEIDTLNSLVKNAGKTPRKKKIRKIYRGMKSFSKMLRKS
ncbi:MAG: hypothetical protein JW882_13590 [Deltaproteobacteria bacterium]|nr:hypothetical protein [Deltaproteobacteria bacterium]